MPPLHSEPKLVAQEELGPHFICPARLFRTFSAGLLFVSGFSREVQPNVFLKKSFLNKKQRS